MCTYNFSLDDIMIDRIRPAFSDDSSIQKWMQQKLEEAISRLALSLPVKEEKKELSNSLSELTDDEAMSYLRSLQLNPTVPVPTDETVFDAIVEEKYMMQ